MVPTEKSNYSEYTEMVLDTSWIFDDALWIDMMTTVQRAVCSQAHSYTSFCLLTASKQEKCSHCFPSPPFKNLK